MRKHRGQMSESKAMAVLLTLAGGFQDAYSYNCRGRVFANAQTGNIVLLGQNIAEGNWSVAARYVVPLASFFLGVYLASRIHVHCREGRRFHWRQLVLMAEMVLLIAAGFLSQSLNMEANAMMSFACAMQVAGFRSFNGLPSATTMCIGNMRSAAELLCSYHVTGEKEERRKSIHYFAVILIFAVGAAVGALSAIRLGERAIWIAAALLCAGFVLMFVKEEKI